MTTLFARTCPMAAIAMAGLFACGPTRPGLIAESLPVSCKLTDAPKIDATTARVTCRLVRFEARNQEATVMSDGEGYQGTGVPAHWLDGAAAGTVLNLLFPETERPPAEGQTITVVINRLEVRVGTRPGT